MNNDQPSRSVWMQPKFIITSMIVIAVVSVVLATFNVIFTNNATELAKDSYGTRRHGHRAFYETLEALEIPVDRRVTPVVSQLASVDTLVLLQPHENLVNSDPKFLSDVRAWVESGGRVLVSPQVESNVFASMEEFSAQPKDVLEELGLDGVFVQSDHLFDSSAKIYMEDEDSKKESSVGRIAEEAGRFFGDENRSISTYSVSFKGDFSHLQGEIKDVSGYSDEWKFLAGAVHMANGLISVVVDENDSEPRIESSVPKSLEKSDLEKVIAATFPVGEGEVIVLAIPCLAENFLLDRSDNASLMAHLVADGRDRVVFDEFYHGRILRGNIFFLLSKLNYATIFLCLFLTASVWSWRQGFFLGPGLDPKQPSRRSLREYVNAMARFFLPGSNSYEFLLTELRSGLIFSAAEYLGHPEIKPELEALLSQLERRNPKLGISVRNKIEQIDRTLLNRGKIRKQDVEKILQEFPSCP